MRLQEGNCSIISVDKVPSKIEVKPSEKRSPKFKRKVGGSFEEFSQFFIEFEFSLCRKKETKHKCVNYKKFACICVSISF